MKTLLIVLVASILVAIAVSFGIVLSIIFQILGAFVEDESDLLEENI
jgi:hypothetical protein